MSLNMINPMGMIPMYPMQPVTIKIDITPAGYQPQANEGEATKNTKSVYEMPKASLYAPKEGQNEVKPADNITAEAIKATAMATPKETTEVKDQKASEAVEPKKVEPKRPEIVKPETMKPNIDLDGLVSILTSDDMEEQADAMEAISEVALYAPDKAEELLDNKVVDNLLNIMSRDTSKMEGKDKELAERNKEYAMFTTATLQKLYADGVKDLAKTVVPADDLIGMAGIVKELKTNKNASVREAAVASIGYMTKPEYKKDLAPLLMEAVNDQDAKVKAQAQKQLEALN